MPGGSGCPHKRQQRRHWQRAFHQEMLDTYETLKRKYRYDTSYFLQMVLEYGEVETARRPLRKHAVSDGFTTPWELKRLDLPVEAYVLRPEYAPLFKDAERGIARARLKEYGYPV